MNNVQAIISRLKEAIISIDQSKPELSLGYLLAKIEDIVIEFEVKE